MAASPEEVGFRGMAAGSTPVCFPASLHYEDGRLMLSSAQYSHMVAAATAAPIWGLVALSTLLAAITVPVLIFLFSG